MVFCLIALPHAAQVSPPTIQDRFSKVEYMIPMRDGAKLYASVYIPKNATAPMPIMLQRTCYSAGPYGPDKFRGGFPGSQKFQDSGYIFAFEDVRGRYMSEGDFVDVRPLLRGKGGPKEIDEATDTYDTIEFLVHNVPQNNNRVGAWGISYPGFYTAVAGVNSHPSLKAISPQAPVTDWFIGDDFHHGGALFLNDAFGFMSGFGVPRPKPVPQYTPGLSPSYPDAYKFFLNLGPLSNANDLYFHHQIKFWDDILAHPNYDAFWQARNDRPGLSGVKCAVMTVGGMFDAEDMYGALNTYQAFEKLNLGIANTLVMGPWFHGGWSRSTGASFGDIDFGQETSVYYRDNVEFPFFDHYLKDGPDPKLPEALVFETGSNQWKSYNVWPPTDTVKKNVYLGSKGALSISNSVPTDTGFDEYVNDPSKPTPYTSEVRGNRNREYMIADQRFAERRPDVVTYQTPVLTEDLTTVGPITADLFASTTGTDADFVVKVIDVLPENTPAKETVPMGGYEMLVRAEVLRGRFRNSFEKPEPFKPGRPTPVTVHLNEVSHCFKKGHRLMLQIQSSWFPLVDRNPNKFVDIATAKPEDYQKATIRIYHDPSHPSHLTIGTKAVQ
jgi:putative CocE/NonD family hydrolase